MIEYGSYIDLLLLVQSVPITTKVVSLIPAHEHEDVYPIQHYLIRFVSDFSPGMLVSSINKSYLHDITCLLLQVTFKMYIKKFEGIKGVTLALKIDIHSTAKMDPVLQPHFNSFSLTYSILMQ